MNTTTTEYRAKTGVNNVVNRGAMAQQGVNQGFTTQSGVLPPGLDPAQLGLNQRQVNMLMSDPRLRQQLLDALQNPNGDVTSFSQYWDKTQGPNGMGLFPSLNSSLQGMAAGVAAYGTFEGLFSKWGGQYPIIVRAANWLDNLPGVKWLSQAADKHIGTPLCNFAHKHFVPSITEADNKAGGAQLANKQFRNERATHYINRFFGKVNHVQVQERAVLDTLHSLQHNFFNDNINAQKLEDLTKFVRTRAKEMQDTTRGMSSKDLHDYLEKNNLVDEFQAEFAKHEADLLPNKRERIVSRIAKADLKTKGLSDEILTELNRQRDVSGLRRVANGITDAGHKAHIEKIINEVEADNKLFEIKKHLDKRLGKGKGLFSGGLKAQDLEGHKVHSLYSKQALEHAEAKLAKNANRLAKPGFISRSIMKMADLTREVFSGRMFGTTGGTWRNRLGAALLAGVMGGFMTFGFAFDSAKRADKGEKTAGFFHNFLGEGIMNFVGWMVTQNLLNTFNVFPRLFDGIGKALGKVPGVRNLKWFNSGVKAAIPPFKWLGFTTAGLFTFITAAFFGGSLFQKIGEKFSDLFFGEPKHIQRERAAMEGKFPTERFDEPSQGLQHPKHFASLLQAQATANSATAPQTPASSDGIIPGLNYPVTGGIPTPTVPGQPIQRPASLQPIALQPHTDMNNQSQALLAQLMLKAANTAQPQAVPVAFGAQSALPPTGVPTIPETQMPPNIGYSISDNHSEPTATANTSQNNHATMAENATAATTASPTDYMGAFKYKLQQKHAPDVAEIKEELSPLPFTQEQLLAIEQSQAYIRDQAYLKAIPKHFSQFSKWDNPEG